MGSVWHAEHVGLKASVAIKLLASDLDGRQDAIARFLREAQLAASLRSPHVVQIFDHGLDEATQTPFIAMELMEGESLAERLARVTRLSPAETTKLVTQVARALTRAQELGIVHRDLKPANLFLVRNEDDEVLKVLDFGLAKWRRPLGSLTQGTATATDQVMGTPYYMSPEQMDGSRDADHRSDLWALGVITFECLTGRRPYEGDNLISIALKVHGGPIPKLPSALALPTELDAWLARALAKDPEQRFQSARELVEALRRACLLESSSSSANSWRGTAELASGARPQAGASGQTVPLQRAVLKAPPAAATPPSANVQSAQPTTRHVDLRPQAESNARKKRPFAWALGALLVGALLALLGAMLSGPKSTAVEDRADAANALPRAAQSPEAPATAAPPALVPSASASVVSEPTTFASAEPQEVVPQAGAAPRASGAKATAAPLSGSPTIRKPPGPAPSGKPLDIERKPTF